MTTALPKTVGEVMTRKVVTITENDTLASLASGIERFRFRHLPVVDDGKLVGLVTHSDLLHASSSFLSSEAEQRNELIHKQPAKLIMQRDVVTVSAEDTLVDAAKLMWEGKFGCLPVVDDDDVLVGIVTQADFLKIFMRLAGAIVPPPPPSAPPR